MKFAEPLWLLGPFFALLCGAMLAGGGALLLRARRRYGEDALVSALMSSRPGVRRAAKALLVVVALAIAFLALAQPQYGRGTRLVPATNLDVVIALDFSKSMHARDVLPSRTERAKVETTRLIRELAGARFGAVAFAGEPMSFPITSDGSAIAQWLRQQDPNQMHAPGTAIAKALNAARELFLRDSSAAKHEKVVVLVTDGEDLVGSPKDVAGELARDGVRLYVVQIGGRAPEPIPDIAEDGSFRGYRTGADGKPLTTSLSADGEATLTELARIGRGTIVRAERGSTGITQVAAALRRLMTEELSERVETVWADVYQIPLAIALLLLLLESLVAEHAPQRSPFSSPRLWVAVVGALAVVKAVAFTLTGVLGFDLWRLAVAPAKALRGDWLVVELAFLLVGSVLFTAALLWPAARPVSPKEAA